MSMPLTIDFPAVFEVPSLPVLTRIRIALTRFFSDLTGSESLPSDATDEAVMAAYQSGNSRAFRMLFDRYAPRIHAAALKRGLSQADAADAVQQTFVHVHQGRSEFRPGAPVRPWIYTVAFNVMRDLGRRVSSQSRLKERFAAEPMHAPEQAKKESDTRLRDALDKLSPPQREVLVLHYFEEMSFSDIAQMLGAGEGAVRVRAHRAYEKLRTVLTRVQTAEDPA